MKKRKREENKSPGKYERREFLKLVGKFGIGTAIGGLIGYLPGKAYKIGRDEYREHVDPYVKKGKKIIDKTNEISDKAKEKGEDIQDWYNEKVNKYINKKEYKRQEEEKLKREYQEREAQEEPEKISRRGFFSKYFHVFNEHPVGTGIATGAIVGGSKKAIQLLPSYSKKKKIARERDEHIDYGKRIKGLENQSKEEYKNKKRLEEELRNELEDEEQEALNNFNESSGLENKLGSDSLETPIAMFVSGITLLTSIIVSSGIKYSGFAVSSQGANPIKIFPIVTLFLSLLLTFIGVMRINKKRK